MFQRLPYDDNLEFDPYDGSRRNQFLSKIDNVNFPQWIQNRKQTWRTKWKPYPIATTTKAVPVTIDTSTSFSGSVAWVNPMFKCTGTTEEDESTSSSCNPITSTSSSTKFLPYDDNMDFDPYDGSRKNEFLTSINNENFSDWLQQRKQKWRKNWHVYKVDIDKDEEDHDEDDISNINSNDFWTNQGYTSFYHWLNVRRKEWSKNYSWNKRKRKRLQMEFEAKVQLPSSSSSIESPQFHRWLTKRKVQWVMLRRTRQRRQEEHNNNNDNNTDEQHDVHTTSPSCSGGGGGGTFVHIDVLLEEEEQKKSAIKVREPLDLSFIFFPKLGCPDDVVGNILSYLPDTEHATFLSISKETSDAIKQRSLMWQQLCPSHWTLPRRPRKPWFELYFSMLKFEKVANGKRWDDLLSNLSNVLWKGDQLEVIKKLVTKGEKHNFSVDYSSGVVCERNSVLNLAVINQRHKVVRWLIEEKGADIETSDRGNFTPLINAAWGGDKYLVRLLLQKGADRSKVGTCHSSRPLAHPDFQGYTAEGWAREKGHEEIAELIRIGL